MQKQAIGIFDSGYGGLTVLKEIVKELPENDFLYLGDNARSPYGPRSFETIYDYTLQAVKYLFAQGCHLVVLACNTASAKALRNIQQLDLPKLAPHKRVLGIIRPTTEIIGNFTQSKHVGILGTKGTVKSKSYLTEIERLWPQVKAFQQACPMWVPLVENGELDNLGASYFIEKDLKALLAQSAKIDTILLACTHYPLLLPLIKWNVPKRVKVVSQGGIVAKSLKAYLLRHPEIAGHCSRSGKLKFQTTGDAADFDEKGTFFFGKEVRSQKVQLSGGM
ncbi:MAG TPA: glutamate racemase [Bacteroidetes bacterium]|nr:glutamate racemase [Bacteroidota bacterium]